MTGFPELKGTKNLFSFNLLMINRAVGSSEKQGGDTLSSEKQGGETLKLILKIAFLRVKLMKSTKNRGAVAPPAP